MSRSFQPGISTKLAIAAALSLIPAAGFAARRPAKTQSHSPAAGRAAAGRASEERSGAMATTAGLRLRLTADQGNVRIFTADSPAGQTQVRYRVRIETDARSADAKALLQQYILSVRNTPAGVQITGETPERLLRRAARGQAPRLWVNFEVTIPANYSVEALTRAGDIETQDIAGAASLVTMGGNIAAGRIGRPGIRPTGYLPGKPLAKLETAGGHISVKDVAGGLHANTAGGHINAGNVAGDALLRSGGGHIRAGTIAGKAQIETDGGNITVRSVQHGVFVKTAGGQIDFGEAYGPVRARTGGGGIRIVHVAGPIELETSDGSICLTRVTGAVRAATRSGTIRAWINPETPAAQPAQARKILHLTGASQLESGQGDIIVYLPHDLAATIDATVEAGGEYRIQTDPALPLKINYSGAMRGSGPVRAEGVLNGGGEVLRLRTGSGSIRLQLMDTNRALREALIHQQREIINLRLGELPEALDASEANAPAALSPPVDDDLLGLRAKIEQAFLGGVRMDPDELQKRLVYSLKPDYPALAKRAGVHGWVRLQVKVDREGKVKVMKVLEGEPVLSDAAIAAAQQWRYRPVFAGGKPVNAISTITFNFQLQAP